MSFLARFRVLTKIIAVVFMLSGIAAGITWLGVNSLKSLSDATDLMEEASGHAVRAATLAQDVIALNRAEYQLGVDPRAESRAAARKKIDERVKAIEEHMAEVGKTHDQKTLQQRIGKKCGAFDGNAERDAGHHVIDPGKRGEPPAIEGSRDHCATKRNIVVIDLADAPLPA